MMTSSNDTRYGNFIMINRAINNSVFLNTSNDSIFYYDQYHEEPEVNDYHVTDVLMAVSIIAGVVSLFGNGIVLGVTVRSLKRMNPFKWLIAHLALCDLLFAILQFMDMPTWIMWRWIYGKFMCKVIPPMLLISSLAAEGTIIVIAIERYKGISNPLGDRWSKRHLLLALFVSWAFSFASASPYFYVVRVVESEEGTSVCEEVWGDNPTMPVIYSLYLFIGNFIIPMVILAVLYGKIIFLVQNPTMANSNGHRSFAQRRRKRDMRATKLLVSVVVAYAICVLPNHLEKIIKPLFEMSESVATLLTYISLVPYPFHCAVNPIIYSIVDSKFRNDIKNLFLCRSLSYDRRTMSVYHHVSTNSENGGPPSMTAVSWVRKVSTEVVFGARTRKNTPAHTPNNLSPLTLQSC